MYNKKFMSSAEVFSWLSQFINLESGQTQKSIRLDRMEVLAELAGHPERCAPVIHIAGSKGKGSITGMITAALEADGRKVARYMSPHVSDIRERISLGNSFFDESVYCGAGDEMREFIEVRVPKENHKLFDPRSEDGEGPTFFEVFTLYFFLCARYSKCDAMVVETGMGGRLDATNIVDPLVSVITLIELEHTKFLGNTIEAVAGEKAGIIKEGRPLILGKQCERAFDVFKKKAAEKRSPLVYFPDAANISGVRVHRGGTDFTLTFNADGVGGRPALFPSPLDLSVPVPGIIQAENAGLAVTALKTAFPEISAETIRRGLANFCIPARFEKISDDPLVIIDGAHTPESAALCAKTFCSLYGEGGILIFGCAADKNAEGMAEILLPHFSAIFVTTPGTFKVSNPEKTGDAFISARGGAGREKTLFIKNTAEAIHAAIDLGRRKNLPVLCAGSFYLAAEIRAVFIK